MRKQFATAVFLTCWVAAGLAYPYGLIFKATLAGYALLFACLLIMIGPFILVPILIATKAARAVLMVGCLVGVTDCIFASIITSHPG